MRNFKNIRRNTPIATLIRRFTDKKSGRVAESRTEIQQRFDHLDWKDQKKLIVAFLQSCRSDREWIYKKLPYFWDSSFEPAVRELWETLHEPTCAWAVIRHFPTDYLTSHLDTFTGRRDYYFICLRLATDPAFVIDRAKLSTTDYLAVLTHTHRRLEEADAQELLYTLMHDICIQDIYDGRLLERYVASWHNRVVSPADMQPIALALYYLRELDCEEVAESFEQWAGTVEQAVARSDDFAKLRAADTDGFSYGQAVIWITRKYAYQMLDARYKRPSDPDVNALAEAQMWGLAASF